MKIYNSNNFKKICEILTTSDFQSSCLVLLEIYADMILILAVPDLFWDKVTLMGCLISNYSCAVLSFEISQSILEGKILAPRLPA